MRIALYEPDIPQNTGTILRLAACLGVEAHIIEPTGFPSSDRAFRRAGMDYLDQVSLRPAPVLGSVQRMAAVGKPAAPAVHDRGRSILSGLCLPVRRHPDVRAGIRWRAGARSSSRRLRLKVPMRPNLRSINVAMTAAMALGEALRQTNGFGHE